MKILLIAVAVAFVAGDGSSAPTQRRHEFSTRSGSLPVMPNEGPQPMKESNQVAETGSQGFRREYRRFGSDALSVNGGTSLYKENSSADRSTNQNNEADTSNDGNQRVLLKPTSRDSSRIQNTNLFHSGALDSFYDVPRIQILSNRQILHTSVHETRHPEGIIELRRQEVTQEGRPFGKGVEQRSAMHTTGLYSSNNAIQARPSLVNQEIQQSEFVKQNKINTFVSKHQTLNQPERNSRSDHEGSEDQRQQTQGGFRDNFRSNQPYSDQHRYVVQNNLRSMYELNRDQNSEGKFSTFGRPRQQEAIQDQDKQSVAHISHFFHEDQIQPLSRSQIPHPSLRQYQQSSLLSPISTKEIASGRKHFEPQRTLASSAEQQQNLGRRLNKDVDRFAHSSGNQQVRNFMTNEKGGSSSKRSRSDAFSNHQNRVLNSKQYEVSSFQLTPRGSSKTTVREEAILPVPQFGQIRAPSIPLAGDKAGTHLVHEIGSLASPHAVVVSKSSAIQNKASMTQHLLTPYAQYTYTHSL